MGQLEKKTKIAANRAPRFALRALRTGGSIIIQKF